MKAFLSLLLVVICAHVINAQSDADQSAKDAIQFVETELGQLFERLKLPEIEKRLSEVVVDEVDCHSEVFPSGT